jgi:hypothetical protein
LVKGDKTVEPDETFFVNLSNASGATIADGQGLGTIVNDDSVRAGPGGVVGDSPVNTGAGVGAGESSADVLFALLQTGEPAAPLGAQPAATVGSPGSPEAPLVAGRSDWLFAAGRPEQPDAALASPGSSASAGGDGWASPWSVDVLSPQLTL